MRSSILLKAELLDNSNGASEYPESFNACLNSHGLYNSFQFVLRLSPEVHRKIANLPKGITSEAHDFDDLQAYSTLLHETIHWWQHIGSTSGFIQSLTFPVQAHMNYLHLKDLARKIGPGKSILQYIDKHKNESGDFRTPIGLANIIVNNFFDIEFFRFLSLNPIRAEEVIQSNFFENLGHSAYITYANTIHILEKTFDEKTNVLPNTRHWPTAFRKLKEKKVIGYYYGSPIELAQIGNLQIYEGQARFNQLQFLFFSSGHKLTWQDAANAGMLNGVYVTAFQCFLKLTGFEWPPTIDHSIVGLFLLTCDIALNPSEGFPFKITDFENFTKSINPGMRFFLLSRTIKDRCPEVATAIKEYSKDEYVNVCETICRHANMIPPHKIAETIAQWPDSSEALKTLMEEQSKFEFHPMNLPIRVLFSHFIAFMKDKFSKPEFFCWPGVWKTGHWASEEVSELFHRQMALFLDKAHDGGIYPRIIPDKNLAAVKAVFDTFYATNVTYDMTRQWITIEGPFKYDYKWLSSNANYEEFKSFGDRHFKSLYGIEPDRIVLY